jgi:para-aminobenzoate synthetase component 1
VNRKFTTFQIDNFNEFKSKMLNWVKPFNIFCFLDNHHYNFSQPSFECLLAAGSLQSLHQGEENVFDRLQNFLLNKNDWIFGHLSYDLKNNIEELSSGNIDFIQFPSMFFFVPEIILILKEDQLQIGVVNSEADTVFNEILSSIAATLPVNTSINLKARFSKEEYLETIKQIQQNILRGDCYEINFCQEFYSDDVEMNPVNVYAKLAEISPNPFAAFYKLNDKYLLCSSPERYLKKEGNSILSQPIKGTAKRNISDIKVDYQNRQDLIKSEKETSENVMVVDLVRNDLSKICEEGSVSVTELFGIYSFPQVHQMISTVAGKVMPDVGFVDILKATFPMGSMTGVPKKRVMQLIEEYERTKRGLFSGAIGYITPDGDFDFNVVIRSILYNATNKYVSLQAGSAITFYSDAEKEYEECLIKIEAMRKVLQ